MQKLHTKHLFENKDTKDLETQIKDMSVEVRRVRYTLAGMPHILNGIKALCGLNDKLYALNDFKASCCAYVYILPIIEKYHTFLKEQMVKYPNYRKFCNQRSKLSEIELPSGEKKQYTHLGAIYDYYSRRSMAIAGRWFILYNMRYLELGKRKKVLPRREKLLEGAIWWCNQGLLNFFGLRMPETRYVDRDYRFSPEMIIFSTLPSSGKSWLANTVNQMFSQLYSMVFASGSVLRVGNEEGNINRQSRQTKSMLENPLYLEIYPENRKYVLEKRVGSKTEYKYDPFNKSTDEEWGLRGALHSPSTSIFKTRSSAITSVRCHLGIFDDPSRGMIEANNIDIHKMIYDLFNGDFMDRFEDPDERFILLLGTMFNGEDVFAKEKRKALRKGEIVDKRFNGCVISKDKRTVVITNDVEDKLGKSAYPEFVSDREVANKKDSLDPYLYACVWRQKPIPVEGLLFDRQRVQWYNLPKTKPDGTFYTKDEQEYLLTKDLTPHSFAYIDPTRKTAGDNFAMIIGRRNIKNNMFYLTDAIYQKRASKDLVDDIIEKIKENNIVKLHIEENVSSTLDSWIDEKLKSQGINFCEITTVYNTRNKRVRIADLAETSIRNILFPSEEIAPLSTDLGQYVKDLVGFSEYSKNDDAPDSLVGFVEKFVVGALARIKNIIKPKGDLPFR